MKLRTGAILLGLAAFLGIASGCGVAAQRRDRPKLVVLIAVDQLRADLLDRYDSLFTGGFRRLRDRGRRYTGAMVEHAITVSHPGHVTLATGMTPARHGIVDAAFFEGPAGERRLVDALEDPAEKILGAPDQKGVSPAKILSSTLPEWFVGADPAARAVAVGSGQYSSLLHAGHFRGDVYWYSIEAGRYVTSTYYRREYPEWVERFNREDLPVFLQGCETWDNLVPEAARGLARPDASPYEGDHVHTTFPHRILDVAPREKFTDEGFRRRAREYWIAVTPALDDATLTLAERSIESLALGRREATDYLSVTLSQVDDIGHAYGPLSQEQLDNLLRIDQRLGRFLSFLDRSVGQGRYLVALSADHGAPDIPEHRIAAGEKARRIRAGEIQALLDAAGALAAKSAQPPERLADEIAGMLRRSPFVADAMTVGELLGSSAGADPFRGLYRNNVRADRVPRFPVFSSDHPEQGIGRYGVLVRLEEGAMIDFDASVHGSPYEYDRHVPMIFFGPGVAPGSSDEPVGTFDLAPTLAALAGVPFPRGLDGHPLMGSPGA
ncbi:MAG TPA: alkaline phosphatase family protein [Candidatus Polarisedimenticolia bacterium]|jgi:predicted AlkP superfamily pyrophosphatase or phosphodiesterase|nr:alkaline phosphatase family protein [Candidatus Polarisedimenticolia bacterium]